VIKSVIIALTVSLFGYPKLSPAVISRIGADNFIVVAPPAKLARTPLLRFDTGDAALDSALISRRFFSVIVGYHRLRLARATG